MDIENLINSLEFLVEEIKKHSMDGDIEVCAHINGYKECIKDVKKLLGHKNK